MKHRITVYAMFCAIFSFFLLTGARGENPFGGEDRYLIHVSTDKPVYRTGEKVFARGVILNAHDHTPLKENLNQACYFNIKGPKGETVFTNGASAENSVAGMFWEIPAGQTGGEYTLELTAVNGYAKAVRKFDIRSYRAPRLKTQIVMLRDGYGPGDKVDATLHVERAEGGIPADAKVIVIARVDGDEAYRGGSVVDKNGNCPVSFLLPKEISRGDGTLVMVINDNGVQETAAKTIPILLNVIDLQMYPEGGDLVAGLPNRIYVEARTPAQKPADIAGNVLDAGGGIAAVFRTEHEGRGRFAFVPQKGVKYTLRITEPSGIAKTYPLPQVKDASVTISSLEDITKNAKTVKLKIGSTSGGTYTVRLAKREKEIISTKVDVKAGQTAEAWLTPPETADGIFIATVLDDKGKPLAERLVFRQPAKTISVTVTCDKENPAPGDKVNLTVKTTDASGKPVSAVVGITVTDDSVLEMIEKREQAPRLPAMVFLENDVKELADAQVYLNDKDPKAPAAMDLLLATQGWRRFAFYNTNEFITQYGDYAKRVLAKIDVPEPYKYLEMEDGGLFVGAAPVPGAPMPQNGVEMAPPDAPQEGAPEQIVEPLKEINAEKAEVDFREELKRDVLGKRANLRLRQPVEFIVMREYAHSRRPDWRPGARADFTETLFWNAGVKTDEKTGMATVSFDINDAVTGFRALADAFGADGSLGQADMLIKSVQPFYIEAKLPLEITLGDIVALPVSVINNTDGTLNGVSYNASIPLSIQPHGPFILAPFSRGRDVVKINFGTFIGAFDMTVSATGSLYSDSVTRKLTIKPNGFPVETAFGGLIEQNSVMEHTVIIPNEVVAGSIVTDIGVYPSPLANLTQALERLIQEPNGCFEQTSSSNYPLVMAQQYFQTHIGVEPALIAASAEKLDRGYAKLVSFECRQKGYEWFGGDPGHEALTAYGLMEFSDMSKVRTVDGAMIERTQGWLLSARDGKGGFQRNSRALDSFGSAPADTTNAYIVWALTESGRAGLDAEIKALKETAARTKDSYVLALAANVMNLAGEAGTAKKIMDQLVKNQAKDGFIENAETSITGSSGDALKIETTSLAVLAWLKEPAYAGAVEKAMKYLTENCKAGRFGSTQSTILALKAIIAYDKARAVPLNPGKLQVVVDGRELPMIEFDKSITGAVKLQDIAGYLAPGTHKIGVKMAGGSTMPYTVTVNYNTTLPISSPECKMGLSVALSHKEIKEGEAMEAKVTVTNRGNEKISMPVAIIGLPGGLEPRHDQLKELVKSGRIDAYEIMGSRELVLYWRGMNARQTMEIPLSLIAAVPGTYTGPASRAYLYYTDEHKTWTEGVKIEITPAIK